MLPNRDWMYTKRTTSNDFFNPTFQLYVNDFLDFAFTNAPKIQKELIEGPEVFKIRCMCAKCQNLRFKSRDVVEGHLYVKGFVEDFKVWYVHGESFSTQDMGRCSNPVLSQHVGRDNDEDVGEYTEYEEMVIESMHQDPNENTKAFYTMLSQPNQPLWPGSENASILSTATRLLNWNSDCNVSDSTFDKLPLIIKDILPDGAKLPRNFYETKKMLKLLELSSQRIHVCENHCMLFNEDNYYLNHCIVCNESRYKGKGNKVPKLAMTYMLVGPRLQRLFYSKKTAQHMTWHADRRRKPGTMSHPSDVRRGTMLTRCFPSLHKKNEIFVLGCVLTGSIQIIQRGKIIHVGRCLLRFTTYLLGWP
ncbi:putative Transposase-associated domain-containing protein [Helianthus debilis subsp. tardiflorus]